MAVAEAAKIVFQTALAGTLESKGFRRVSDTNYVIEGDGVEWRVVFGPEFPDDPGTFRDETGIFLPEVDQLYQRAFPKDGPVSEPMAMTRYRAHYSTHISARYNHTENSIGNVNAKLDDVEPCFRSQEWSQGRREYWVTKSHNLEALGSRIDKYWRDLVWPWLEDCLTKQDACRGMDGSVIVHGFQTGLFGPWVCGHHDLVFAELERRKSESTQSDDAIYKLLLDRKKNEYPYLQWIFEKPTKADIEDFRISLNRRADLANRLIGFFQTLIRTFK